MLNINDLKNMTAAELRQIENVIAGERSNAVAYGFKEMAKILKKEGPMPASVAGERVGMTPGQIRHPDNKYRRIEAGVEYFYKTEAKTFTCLEDGETITVNRTTLMVRLR